MFDFPSSPAINDTYTNSGVTFRYNGVGWTVIGTSGGGSTLSVSDTAPSDPVNGQLWFKSDTGVLYLRYQDVDGSQWIPAVQPGAAGPVGPPGQWVQLTQAQYNALSPPNPTTLYVIVG